jgi:hypothetical protein
MKKVAIKPRLYANGAALSGLVLNCLFWSLIIQRVQNADINHSTQWIIKLQKVTFDEKGYITKLKPSI